MAKKNKKKGRAGKKFMTFLIILVVLGAAWFFWQSTRVNQLVPSRDASSGLLMEDDRINVLILGTDQTESDGGRSDAILLAGLDFTNGRLSILSIPRDTYVDIPDHGWDKINHAYALGGEALVAEVVQDLLKVPVDYYAKTNFAGFEKVIDLLGGVDIDVDKRMYYRTYDGLIDIEAGPQHLNGEKALQYVRFRHDPLGDITRTERQQNFLSALYQELTATDNINKLPKVVPALLEVIDTDFSNAQLITLASMMDDFDRDNIFTATLPGSFMNKNTISYWQYDEDKVAEVVKQLFLDQEEQDNNN